MKNDTDGVAEPKASPARPVAAQPDVSTRDRVFAELLASGPISTATLAARLGLTTPAVRRHLDALEAEGLIASREQIRRGPRGRGRPAQAFVVTDAGRERHRKAYGQLARQAIDELVASVGPSGLDRVATRHFSPIDAEYRRLVAQDGESDPGTVLATALDREGYVASIVPSPNGEQLCQHHCPVADIARAYPQLCQIETDLIAHLLNVHVQRLATIAHGDGVCTTHIPTPLADTHRRKDDRVTNLEAAR